MAEKSKQELYEEAKRKREEERKDKAEKDKARRKWARMHCMTTPRPRKRVCHSKKGIRKNL